ncbi:MAG: protein kinase [bacterium]|nr:protein kinase [bacterium]
MLSEPLGRNPAFAERFHREARVLAKLHHPSIVSVFDFGQAGGFFYLLMEYVDGANLRQAMRAGRFTPGQALEIVPKICEALQFAHEHGVLHRDIKPENILLDGRGRVKIADFGIAKLVGGGKADVTLTASGASLGTPAYMAPEQIERPGEVDHRADIYSLGVVFYEMLTGELPLGRFAPPSQKTPLDERVDEIVLRALAKERELRQQSATEVRTQVEGVTSSPSGAVPVAGEAASTRTVPAGSDFILCNPRLPRMAQAITVYGLVIAPFLWALGLGLTDFDHLSAHPGAAFLEGMWQFFGEILAGLATTIVLLVGAVKLRGLKADGPAWLKGAVWSRIGLMVAGLAVITWAAVLDWESEVTGSQVPLAEAVVLAVMLVATGWEIAMLVWLRRHRAVLETLGRDAKAASTG